MAAVPHVVPIRDYLRINSEDLLKNSYMYPYVIYVLGRAEAVLQDLDVAALPLLAVEAAGDRIANHRHKRPARRGRARPRRSLRRGRAGGRRDGGEHGDRGLGAGEAHRSAVSIDTAMILVVVNSASTSDPCC